MSLLTILELCLLVADLDFRLERKTPHERGLTFMFHMVVIYCRLRFRSLMFFPKLIECQGP